MKEIEILGANRFDTFTRTRGGSRAVTIKDGMILLSHETISGWYLIPGGGLEDGETPEARRGLEPQWIPLREAVDIFSRHQSYAMESEEKRGSYLREYTALQEYLQIGSCD